MCPAPAGHDYVDSQKGSFYAQAAPGCYPVPVALGRCASLLPRGANSKGAERDAARWNRDEHDRSGWNRVEAERGSVEWNRAECDHVGQTRAERNQAGLSRVGRESPRPGVLRRPVWRVGLKRPA